MDLLLNGNLSVFLPRLLCFSEAHVKKLLKCRQCQFVTSQRAGLPQLRVCLHTVSETCNELLEVTRALLLHEVARGGQRHTAIVGGLVNLNSYSKEPRSSGELKACGVFFFSLTTLSNHYVTAAEAALSKLEFPPPKEIYNFLNAQHVCKIGSFGSHVLLL